jgi:hypothetical protein
MEMPLRAEGHEDAVAGDSRHGWSRGASLRALLRTLDGPHRVSDVDHNFIFAGLPGLFHARADEIVQWLGGGIGSAPGGAVETLSCLVPVGGVLLVPALPRFLAGAVLGYVLGELGESLRVRGLRPVADPELLLSVACRRT